MRIKLPDQPFQLLCRVLERPGTDPSLNGAVKKLRQALNDDSENPRFVETLYRRGYRFIGPVK